MSSNTGASNGSFFNFTLTKEGISLEDIKKFIMTVADAVVIIVSIILSANTKHGRK